MDPVLVLGVSALLMLLGGGLLFMGISAKRTAGASRAWPSAPGTIISSQVLAGGGGKSRWYKAQVTYTFAANGQTYTGERVMFGDARSSSMAKEERVVAQYVQGAPVEVFYNPQQPQEAVLERRTSGTTLTYLILGAVVLMLSVFVAVMGMLQ